MRRDSHTDDGFTLIELLVVMIVIGILAAIAIPAFISQQRKAYEAAAKSDVTNMAKEVVGYYVDGKKPLTVGYDSASRKWTLSDGGSAVADGILSKGSILVASTIASADSYCVSVGTTLAGTADWQATQGGLSRGSC